jgi:hypothetical protein
MAAADGECGECVDAVNAFACVTAPGSLLSIPFPSMGAPSPPPGWYPDPSGAPGTTRWWNGTAWAGVPTAATPPPPTKNNRQLFIALGVLGAFVVVLAVIGAVSGGDDKKAETASSSSRAPSSVFVPKPTTAQTSSPATMSAWKKRAADSVGNVGDALTAVGTAMQTRDLTGLHSGCADLRQAVDQLERQLPSPDRQLDAAFQDAIDNYRSLSQLCMTIGPTSTKADIDQMQPYLDTGSGRMCDAYGIMGLDVRCR